jgi:hypothetical protein
VNVQKKADCMMEKIK